MENRGEKGLICGIRTENVKKQPVYMWITFVDKIKKRG